MKRTLLSLAGLALALTTLAAPASATATHFDPPHTATATQRQTAALPSTYVYFNEYVTGASAARGYATITGSFYYALSWSSERGGHPCVTDLRLHNLSNGFEVNVAKGGMVYGVYRNLLASKGTSRWEFQVSMSAASDDNCLGHGMVYR